MKKIAFFLAVIALLAITKNLPAQGTAFTYQGQLQNNGGPANGSFDFTFALFDTDSTNEGQVGSTVTNVNVGVTNGLFTVALDFGSAFTGQAAWLAIGVRANGGTSFTALSPLQELTPTPYALYAPNAGMAASASSVAGSNIVGTIAAAQLPPNIVTNGASEVVLGGANTAIAPLTVTPTAPASVAGSDSQYEMNQVVVVGRYAYGVGASGMTEWDVSVPSSPKQLAGIGGTPPGFNGVATDGRYAYVLGSTQLFFYDLSDPGNLASNFGYIPYPSGAQANSIALSGRYAYVTFLTSTGGLLAVYDISKPLTPVLISSTAVPISANSVAVQGRYAYVTEGTVASGGSLQIFDINSPATPVSAGSATVYYPQEVAVSGGYAYVGGGSTFSIVDIGNPTSASVVASTNLGFYVTSVAVEGRYAVVADSATSRIYVFDVSNPSAPVIAGTFSGLAKSIALSGRYAYVATGNGGLQIYDLGGAYAESIEVGSIEAGNLQTRDAAAIGGNLNVLGASTIGQSALVRGGLSVGGTGVASSNYTIFANGVVAGVGAYVNASDARYKTNIAELTHALDKVMAMRGVTYDWRRSAFPQVNFDNGKQVGFIAQELKNILPEAVTQDPQGYYGIAYSKVIPVLAEAIKDQQKEMENETKDKNAEIEALKEKAATVDSLERQNDSLTQRLNELEAAVKAIASKK